MKEVLLTEFYDELEDYLVGHLIDQVEESEGMDIELIDFEEALTSIESVEKDLYYGLQKVKTMN
jgi:hypothetical protein